MPPRPGEKPCGGAVPETVLSELPGFDPGALPAVRATAVLCESGAGGEGGDGSRLQMGFGGVRIFRRRDFDAALLRAAERAGARLRRTTAERLEPRPGGVAVVAEGARAEFDFVVCADGARSQGRRLAGLRPRGESVGLGASLGALGGGTLVLGLPGVADCYLWIFPRPGGVSVGAAYSADRLSDGAARALLRAFLDRHLGSGWERLAGPRYRYPIPVFGEWSLPAVEEGLRRRLLLVGDAAALADPLTREGIRYALRSGRWAAESLLAGRPREYPERLRAELAPELERAGRARELFFEDPIGRWMVPVSRRHPGVRAVLADLLACRQPYRGLRRRLLAAALGVPRRQQAAHESRTGASEPP